MTQSLEIDHRNSTESSIHGCHNSIWITTDEDNVFYLFSYSNNLQVFNLLAGTFNTLIMLMIQYTVKVSVYFLLTDIHCWTTSLLESACASSNGPKYSKIQYCFKMINNVCYVEQWQLRENNDVEMWLHRFKEVECVRSDLVYNQLGLFFNTYKVLLEHIRVLHYQLFHFRRHL